MNFATSETQQLPTASGPGVEDYVEKLLKDCKEAWSEYMNHQFPKQLANGTADLNCFRHYMIQDCLYLEHYYGLKTKAVNRSGTPDEIKDVEAKLPKSLDWVTSLRKNCTSELGVPESEVTDESASQALQDSIALYKEVHKNGDWLDINIVFLPCVLGYYTIASKLLNDPGTIRNTKYYNLWVKVNANSASEGSAKGKKDFINTSIGKLSKADRKKRWPDWVENFNKACEKEMAFFGLGIPSSTNIVPVYNVVRNGTYSRL